MNAESESESDESDVTTDGQSVSLSWNKAPIWGLRPDFFTVRQSRVCLYGALSLSLTRGRVCRLLLLLALASAVILGSESRGTCDHILLSQIRDFPFRRLLRLAGLRWRYSTPSPHVSPLYNFGEDRI
jgi:membrane-associated phospholipid phosphatase